MKAFAFFTDYWIGHRKRGPLHPNCIQEALGLLLAVMQEAQMCREPWPILSGTLAPCLSGLSKR